MMPKPKMEALLKAPPKKVSNKPKMPSACPLNFDGSTPGKTTKEPKRKINSNNKVVKMRPRSSSMEKMFFNVSLFG